MIVYVRKRWRTRQTCFTTSSRNTPSTPSRLWRVAEEKTTEHDSAEHSWSAVWQKQQTRDGNSWFGYILFDWRYGADPNGLILNDVLACFVWRIRWRARSRCLPLNNLHFVLTDTVLLLLLQSHYSVFLFLYRHKYSLTQFHKNKTTWFFSSRWCNELKMSENKNSSQFDAALLSRLHSVLCWCLCCCIAVQCLSEVCVSS